MKNYTRSLKGKMTPEVSAIVLTKNSQKHIRTCIVIAASQAKFSIII